MMGEKELGTEEIDLIQSKKCHLHGSTSTCKTQYRGIKLVVAIDTHNKKARRRTSYS